MSTRCTISHSNDYHLYQECFEQDNVYLLLDGGDWSASLESAAVDWRDGDSSRPRLHVRMNVTLWRQIVSGWLESQWGQNPEGDHKKMDFDPESTLKWLEEYERNKQDGNTV
jgi:hypothetical protein